MGDVSVPFVNGTSNFTNLAISHNGTGYKIKYHVTYPLNVSFEIQHGDITIKERRLDFVFTSNITTAYDSVNIRGLPTVTVYDQVHRTQVETGWKGRDWFLSAQLLPGQNVGAIIMGDPVVSIFNGTASLKNISISKPGENYRLKLSVYTTNTYQYMAEYTTPYFTG